MLVYVIRHGQTDWNVEGRLQGQRDIPLNTVGQGQANDNGTKLKALIGDGEGFAFISSPLGRTRETMQRVRTSMGLPPMDYATDARLKELSFGDWEGFTIGEVKEFAPERAKERSRNKWNFIPPGEAAESYEILSWRIGAWLGSLTGPTVAVTHGGVIRSLFRLIAGLPDADAAELPVPQDRILRIETDDRRIEWLS